MPDLDLQKLLGKPGLGAKLTFADIEDLTQPVSTGPLQAVSGSLNGSAEVPVLGRSVALSASINAGAEILGVGEPVTVYKTDLLAGEEVSPGDTSAFAKLQVIGKAGVSGKSDFKAGSASVSLSGAASAEIELQHMRAFSGATSRTNALVALAGSSLLPGSKVQIDKIGPGEYHSLRALFDLGLNASVQAGWEGSVERALFDGLDAEVEAAFKATMQASFGLALYEKLELSVGTLAVDEDDWVRVAMERVSQRRLTLGALFALQVKYDLGSGLTALLDHILELAGWPEIEASLKKLSALATPIAEGKWDEVKAAIDDKTVDLLKRFLSIDDFLDSVTSQKAVQEFVGLASRAVKAYEGLEPKLQSLFDRALAYADLEPGAPIRQALETIAGLKGKTLDDLLGDLAGDSLGRAVDLLEVLTGQSLEDLAVSSDVDGALRRAANAAAQGVKFLNDCPSEVVDKIHKFAEESGIAGVIAFLEENATSVDDLKAKLEEEANQFLAKAVQRITGKLFEQLDEEDLERLQRWAARVKALLDDITSIDDRLRKALQKLEGEVGFSLGIELDRMTRRTKLLDIELDPSVKACRTAFRQLRTGELGQFLEKLPDLASDEHDGGDLPYQIRECTFVSLRVRSVATSIFFSIVGWDKSTRRRTEEVRIQIEQGDDDTFRRTGRYHGGHVTTYEGDGHTWSGGLALVGKAKAGDKILFGKWDELTTALRLTSVRSDDGSTPVEIRALETLLADLGFEDAERIRHLPIPQPKAATRLSFTVETEPSVLDAFLAGIAGLSLKQMKTTKPEWDAHARNAGYRWFDTGLIPLTLPPRPDVQKGPVLAGVVKSSEYAEKWTSGVNNVTYTVTLSSGGQVKINTGSPPYAALFELGYARGEGVSRLPRLRADRKTAMDERTHKSLRKLIRRSSRLSSRLTPRSWESPLFSTWLVMARLAHDQPEALLAAKGLATLRWKNAQGEWSPPEHFKLANGLAQHAIGGSVFPIS